MSPLYHSVVLHVAGCANRLPVLHDVGLSSQHTVTVKTAEVLQVPIVSLSLGVLVTEDELETTHTHTHFPLSIVLWTIWHVKNNLTTVDRIAIIILLRLFEILTQNTWWGLNIRDDIKMHLNLEINKVLRFSNK